RVFDGGVGFAGRHVHAFGKELEVVDQVFHAGLHALALRRRDLVVVDDDGTRIVAQPFHALANDAIAFAHLGNAHHVAVVAIAVHAYRDVEIQAIVDFVGLHATQVPFDARTTEHRPREAQRLGAFR